MTEIETTLRQLITEIVDERIGSAVARGDAMARMYGEYVNLGTAAKIMGVSRPTVDKLRQEGALEFVPRVGVSVRSMAHLGDLRKTKGSPQRAVVRTSASMRIEP